MKEALKQGAVRTSRRTFLGRALATIFGVFAGLSVGVPRVEALGCIGPNGSGYCGSGPCAGYRCSSGGGVYCRNVSGFCDNDSTPACWNSGAHRCCDCRCSASNGYTFYCYCHG